MKQNNRSATLIYPHQLYKTTFAVFDLSRPVYLVEEPLFLTEFPIHRQKLLLHRLSLQAYKLELEAAGFIVHYLDIKRLKSTSDVFNILNDSGISEIHLADTTDNWLEKRIEESATIFKLKLIRYQSPLFILESGDATARYQASGRHMANFYKKLRTDLDILMTKDSQPVGGQFSFDEQNRQKIPRHFPLPEDIKTFTNPDTEAALIWLDKVPGEKYGEAQCWIPYTRAAAEAYLQDFFKNRFEYFGTYEDAISSTEVRLFHSTISPLLNIGLLEPRAVIEAALDFAQINQTPINSLEGFIRQILGWREFIRAAYELDGTKMRSQNFFNHKRPLPSSFWDNNSSLTPIRVSLGSAFKFGYNHHIERLMVLGNYLILNQTHPDEVYRWFMAMYVDAYDWVMVPNVYGMSQFADGGLFATKPYISGSNYLKKMSNYEPGPWEELWTALYWNFIAKHEAFFTKNHRLAMMPRLLRKINPEKLAEYQRLVTEHFKQNFD